MPTTLLIESDSDLRIEMREALQNEGFSVVDVESGEAGLIALGAHDPEIILTEAILERMSGADVVREARRVTAAPIVVVGETPQGATIIEALELGADAYMAKPLDFGILAARCRALLRRASVSAGVEDDLGLVLDSGRGLVLHEASGTVLLAGVPVHLTKTEFRLLVELATDAGRVLSRAQLLDRVWDDVAWAGSERVVDVHVSRLRSKIESDVSDPELVVTVRGQGYRLDLR